MNICITLARVKKGEETGLFSQVSFKLCHFLIEFDEQEHGDWF